MASHSLIALALIPAAIAESISLRGSRAEWKTTVPGMCVLQYEEYASDPATVGKVARCVVESHLKRPTVRHGITLQVAQRCAQTTKNEPKLCEILTEAARRLEVSIVAEELSGAAEEEESWAWDHTAVGLCAAKHKTIAAVEKCVDEGITDETARQFTVKKVAAACAKFAKDQEQRRQCSVIANLTKRRK